MAKIGSDCHLKFYHPSVAGGEGWGFILDPGKDGRGTVVSVEREVSGDGEVWVRLFFNILLADDLLNPDGSAHARDRAESYARLLAYLDKTEDLTLETAFGVFSGLGATGHAATELHFGSASVVACQLNNAGPYFPPADAGRYYASQWDGSLDWASSYWR